MTTGMEHASTSVLLTLRANMLRGLDTAAVHMEAGTLDASASEKAVPPREAACLTLALIELVEETLEGRGVEPLRTK